MVPKNISKKSMKAPAHGQGEPEDQVHDPQEDGYSPDAAHDHFVQFFAEAGLFSLLGDGIFHQGFDVGVLLVSQDDVYLFVQGFFYCFDGAPGSILR
jgi:hypothetical protein